MANNWLDSALNLTGDILAMAKGFDEGNKAAVPSVATPPLVAPARVVPEGMTSTPAQPSSQTLLLVAAGIVVLFLLLR